MTASVLKSRAMVAAIFAAATAAFVLVCAWKNLSLVGEPLVVDSLLIVAWLAAGLGIGWPIVARLRLTKNGPLAAVSAIAVGLGIISLIVLALGLAGWLNQQTAIALVAAGAALSLWPLWRRRNDIETWWTQPAGEGWLWLALVWPMGVAMTGALMPPGVLWGDEPNGYDVVEYHLQIPRQWFDAGKIVPLKENVFSYFPQGMEMHYLLAMQLHDGPWAGMYLAQFMHVAMCVLAVTAAAAAAGMWAGLIVAAAPWLTLLAPIAYVEGAYLLFGTLAIVWAMRAKDWRPMLLAGLFAGFACGVKLTGGPTVVAGVFIAAAIAWPKGAVKRLAIFSAAAAATIAPWLIRTGVWAGNPVFPEAMNLLGHAHFTAVQVERWRRAYLPTTSRLDGLIEQIIADWRYGYVLLPAGLLAAILSVRQRETRFLLAMLAILTIFWLFFTHLQSRFYVLAIPICALLIAQGPWRWLEGVVVAATLLAGMMSIGARMADYHMKDAEVLLGLPNCAALAPSIMLPLTPYTHVDLVGTAEPFIYPIPSRRLGYRTVFDVDTSKDWLTIVDDWLGGSSMPQPHRIIIVDVAELDRLARTYYRIPKLSEEELRLLSLRRDVFMSSH